MVTDSTSCTIVTLRILLLLLFFSVEVNFLLCVVEKREWMICVWITFGNQAFSLEHRAGPSCHFIIIILYIKIKF